MKTKLFSKFNKDLFFGVMVIVFFFLSSNAYAQDEYLIDLSKVYPNAIETTNKGHNVDEDEYNIPRNQIGGVVGGLSNLVIFMDPSATVGGEDIAASATSSNDMKRGVYGLAQDGVYAMYRSQPLVNVYAHLAEEWVPGYQSDTAIYAGLIDYDYESGYDELVHAGISDIWSQVRNITYIFFIVIMIVVGFMLMFRSKIGGQTLVTLGNSLPNIVIALIGVTFSFAIAGLIIDLGGVIMVVLADIMQSISGYDTPITLESIGSIFRAFVPQGLFQEMFQFSSNSGGKGFLGIMFGGAGGSGIVAGVLALFGASAAATTALTVGLPFLIIFLAILGVATVGVFKVFITLIKAYVGILIGVITGPIQIAMGAIPGKGNSFINWILSILRNVLVYPITFAILNIPGIVYAISDVGLSLPGPDKLTLTQSVRQMNQSQDFIGTILIFVLQIFVLFAASKADQYVKAILPPTTSKAGGDAAMAAKQALSGIPLIGSLLK